MNNGRLLELIDAMLEGTLSESNRAELTRMLGESAAMRTLYWEIVEQEVLLQEAVRESAGRDMARMSLVEPDFAPTERQANLERPKSRKSTSWIPLVGFVATVSLLMAIGLRSWWKPATEAVSGHSVATLRSITGDVWLVGSKHAPERAISGQPFNAGDAVQVGEEGTAEVVLTDGSRVVLNADSLLRFVSVDSLQRLLHLQRGGAEIDSAPQSPSVPLIITTDQARLTVLETRFRLYAAVDDSRVELEEGRVLFERQSDGQSVNVSAGEFAVATTVGETTQPLVAQTLHTEWRLRQTLLRAGSRVAFSHGGSQLATAGHQRVKVWDVATGEVRHQLVRGGRPEKLAFTASDDAIVAIDYQGRATFWPIGATAILTELETGRGKLRQCAVSRDGRWLAQTTSDDAGHLPVWQVRDTGTVSLLRSLPMKAGGVAISGTATGPQVVASNWNGTTVKWNAETGLELSRSRFRSESHVVELSADGRLLAGYGHGNGLLLVDTETGTQRNLWPAGSVQVSCLRFSRDGSAVFAAMADGVVRAWSVEDGESLFVLVTGDARLTSLDVADNGRWLAVAGASERVTIWQSDLDPQQPQTPRNETDR